MAKRVSVDLVDDIDDSYTADETVEFGIDGVSYEIDLHRDHAAELRGGLSKFVEHARRVAGSRSRRSSTGAHNSKERLTAIRAWAHQQGREISSRGRIPREVIAEFDAAQAATSTAATSE